MKYGDPNKVTQANCFSYAQPPKVRKKFLTLFYKVYKLTSNYQADPRIIIPQTKKCFMDETYLYKEKKMTKVSFVKNTVQIFIINL